MSFLVGPRSPAKAMEALFSALAEMKAADAAMNAGELSNSEGLVTFDNAASLAIAAADQLREADVLEEIDGFLTVLYDGVPK